MPRQSQRQSQGHDVQGDIRPSPLRECPPGYIRNPQSHRCIKAGGKVAKSLGIVMDCPPGTVRNPATGKCVKADGALGKRILKAQRGASTSNNAAAVPFAPAAPAHAGQTHLHHLHHDVLGLVAGHLSDPKNAALARAVSKDLKAAVDSQWAPVVTRKPGMIKGGIKPATLDAIRAGLAGLPKVRKLPDRLVGLNLLRQQQVSREARSYVNAFVAKLYGKRHALRVESRDARALMGKQVYVLDAANLIQSVRERPGKLPLSDDAKLKLLQEGTLIRSNLLESVVKFVGPYGSTRTVSYPVGMSHVYVFAQDTATTLAKKNKKNTTGDRE